MRAQSQNLDGNHHMQLTEDEIAVRVGLPGPVIAELLHPAAEPDRGPSFGETDVLRAQVAALMLACGMRWPAVQTAMDNAPGHPDLLRAALDFWTAAAPSPMNPRHWPFAATTTVTALMVLALLIGLALGLYLRPQGLL